MLVFESLIVYTLLAFLMYKFAQMGEHESKLQGIYNTIPILLFTLVFGLRYNVGVDWLNYADAYDGDLQYMQLEDITDNVFEPAFNFIVYICHQLSLSKYGLFSVLAFIQITLIYATLKKTDRSLIKYVYVAFIFSGFAITDFTNVIRQHISVCFFMYGLTFVPQKQYIKYWICCVLALLFHHSALIIFPLCFIWIRRSDIFQRPAIQSVILAICFIATFFDIIPKILSYTESLITLIGYDNYIDQATDLTFDTKFSVSRLIEVLSLFIIVYFSNDIKKHYNSDLFNMMYDLFFIGICCKYLFLGNMMFRRISLYFIDYYFILYGAALAYFAATYKTQTRNFVCAVYIYFAIFMLYAKQIYYCESSTGAYVTCFQEDLHYLKDTQRQTLMSNMN